MPDDATAAVVLPVGHMKDARRRGRRLIGIVGGGVIVIRRKAGAQRVLCLLKDEGDLAQQPFTDVGYFSALGDAREWGGLVFTKWSMACFSLSESAVGGARPYWLATKSSKLA
jgi:hypothetical protein